MLAFILSNSFYSNYFSYILRIVFYCIVISRSLNMIRFRYLIFSVFILFDVTWCALGDECSAPPPLVNGVINFDDFSVGSVIEYNCNNGYVLKGDEKSTCQDDITWSGKTPICEPGCSSPPKDLQLIYFADIKKLNFAVGEKVSYNCRYGYLMIGDSTIECQADYTWTVGNFECSKIQCGDPGNVTDGYIEPKDFSFGSTITYHCEKGFKIDDADQKKRKCQIDGMWSGEPRACNKIKCRAPKNLENGVFVVADEEFFYRTLVKYSCDHGYELVGTAQGECNEDGNWGEAPVCTVDVNCDFDGLADPLCFYTSQEGRWERQLRQSNTISGHPTYVLRAINTPAVLHSPVLPRNLPHCFRFNYFIRGMEQESDFVITETNGKKVVGKIYSKEKRMEWLNQQVTVKPGQFFGNIHYAMTVEDKSTKIDFDDFSLIMGGCANNCVGNNCMHGATCVNRIDSYSCVCTRFYEGERCEKETICQPIESVENAVWNISPNPDMLRVETEIQFSCREGFKHTRGPNSIKCNDNGEWSDWRRPICKKITCHGVAALDFGYIEMLPEVSDEISIGTSVRFMCQIDRYMLDGPSAIVCLKDGRWSNPRRPTCPEQKRRDYDLECPAEYRKKGTMCYKEFKDRSSYYEAESKCAKSGAKLSIIRSAEEWTRLHDIVSTGKYYHIGLDDLGQVDLKWSDGNAFEKLMKKSYPGDFSPKTDITNSPRCGAFISYQRRSEIITSLCHNRRGFICETFPSSVLPVLVTSYHQNISQVDGIYRPLRGVSHNNEAVYKIDGLSEIYLYKVMDVLDGVVTSGWSLGYFDLYTSLPGSPRVVEVITDSNLPQNIRDAWKIGSEENTDLMIRAYDQWGKWTEWSECSVSCGGGSQIKTRDCNQKGGAAGFGDCPGKFLMQKDCNTRQCIITRWDLWESWTRCSEPCGGGESTRKRMCIKDPLSKETCIGPDMNRRQCNTQTCTKATTDWIRFQDFEYKIVDAPTNPAMKLEEDCLQVGGKLINLDDGTVMNFIKHELLIAHCGSKSAYFNWKLQTHALNAPDEGNPQNQCSWLEHQCDPLNSSWLTDACDNHEATGFVCEREWKPCNRQPCFNSGQCVNVAEEYKCICTNEYQGKHCRKEIKCNVKSLIKNYKVSYLPSMKQVKESKVKKFVQLKLSCKNKKEGTTDKDTFTCTGMNKWDTRKTPKIFCEKVCTVPKLGTKIVAVTETGEVIQPGGVVPIYSLLFFECSEDFMAVVGEPSASCLEDGWDVELPKECDFSFPCDIYSEQKNAQLIVSPKFQKESYKPGTVVTLSCNKNYQPSGEETTKCQHDGRWSNKLGFCTDEELCGLRVSDLPNDVNALTTDFEAISRNNLFAVGEYIYLECKKNKQSTLKVFSCERNRVWSSDVSSFCN